MLKLIPHDYFICQGVQLRHWRLCHNIFYLTKVRLFYVLSFWLKTFIENLSQILFALKYLVKSVTNRYQGQMIIGQISLYFCWFYPLDHYLVASQRWFSIGFLKITFEIDLTCFLWETLFEVRVYLDNAFQIVFAVIVNFIQLKLKLFYLFSKILSYLSVFIRTEKIFPSLNQVLTSLLLIQLFNTIFQNCDTIFLNVKFETQHFRERQICIFFKLDQSLFEKLNFLFFILNEILWFLQILTTFDDLTGESFSVYLNLIFDTENLFVF